MCLVGAVVYPHKHAHSVRKPRIPMTWWMITQLKRTSRSQFLALAAADKRDAAVPAAVSAPPALVVLFPPPAAASAVDDAADAALPDAAPRSASDVVPPGTSDDAQDPFALGPVPLTY